MHINNMHKIEGVNLVKPSEIFAKLFEAIPVDIPIAKIRYPINGFMCFIFKRIYVYFNGNNTII